MKFPKKIKNKSKVIGYYARTNSGYAFCHDDAGVIAGRKEKLESYLLEPDNGEKFFLKKIRFGEILKGMKLGDAFTFDVLAFAKFKEVAQMNGIENLPAVESDTTFMTFRTNQ